MTAGQGAALECVRIEVVTTGGRAAGVQFRIDPAVVTVWSREQCCAIFGRERLRCWLAHPRRWIAEGQVVLNVDPRSDGERIAISLPDVIAWTLSPKETAALTTAV